MKEANGCMRNLRVISGGQTGADQGALEAAMRLGLETGGWCPPGRYCESGPIPQKYILQETETERSTAAPDIPRSLRTELNVRDADATLILLPASMQPDRGTRWTLEWASRMRKPVLVADPAEAGASEKITDWLRSTPVSVLNVAGPSEMIWPGIFLTTCELLVKVFQRLR